jgi:hypothetical protein
MTNIIKIIIFVNFFQNWTITTNIPKGHIAEIHRQGDCIMILPMGDYTPINGARHLTEQEYRELIVNES